MSEGNNSKKSWWQWWQTLPGIFTGTGGTIAAIAAALIAALAQWDGGRGKKDLHVDALNNCTTPFQHSKML
jgi:hypothetical protein